MEREKLVSLVKAVQSGRETAAAELYDSFYDDIYYFILKSVDNDPELAADLTQDTFMEILETIGKLQEPAAFVTWSRQIAYHKCTAYFRKRREILLDEAEDGYSAFDTVEEERAEFIPDEALNQEDFRQTIREMIDKLPNEQRSALLLRYFNEVSVNEIAKIQGVTEGTVKSRLNYARKAIKQAVESYEKKNGIRLHIAGVGPMLLWFFRACRRGGGGAIASGTAGAVYSATGSSSSAAAAASTGAAAAATGAKAGLAAMGKVAATKVVAAVAAAAVGIAGVTAVVTNLLKKPEPEKWTGFACEYQTERYLVGTEFEGHVEEITTAVENSQMTIELELLEAEEYAYTGNITVTWEDGEVFRTPCRLGDFHSKKGVNIYTLYIDPMFTRSATPEVGYNQIDFINHLNIMFSLESKEMDIDYISEDCQIMGELTTRKPEDSLLVTQPIQEQPASITEPEYGDDLLAYMKRIDGTYGWVDGEEAELIQDYYADSEVEDGQRRAYPCIMYLRLPNSDEVTAHFGFTPEYREYSAHWEIGEEVDGMPVTRIRYFNDFETTSVEIPNSVVVIEDYAFRHCVQLKNLDIPESVRYIGEEAFYSCTSLEEIGFSEGLKSIGDYAFQDCDSLKKLELPEGLETVGATPFYDCNSLEKITLPSTLVDVENCLVYRCPSLKTLEVAEGNPVYHSSGNCIIETETNTLIVGCKESEIPTDGSVTVIGRYSFAANRGLTELVIPEGVTEIGYCAFVKCENLSKISLPASLQVLDDQAFKDCENLRDIYYAGTMAEFGKIQGMNWEASYHDFGFTVHCSDGDLKIG